MTKEDWQVLGLFVYGGALITAAVAFLWWYAGRYWR